MQSNHILTQRTAKLEKIQQFCPLAQPVQDPPSALLTAKQLHDLRRVRELLGARPGSGARICVLMLLSTTSNELLPSFFRGEESKSQ